MAQQTFEELVAAVKQAESRGKRYKDDGKTLTTSPKGALGEMQVMPKTILDPGFGVAPAKDKSPDEIARVGVDYLQAMKQKYGDTEKALIAYNWGPGSTDKWLASGADPKKLPEETKTYVERVKGFLGKDVPRETMAKTEPTPAEEIMTKALPAGTTAQAPKATTMAKMDVKSMPASYQAAFALAALADAQDEEDDKVYNENRETESEKLMREYKPVNHLAALDLSVKPITMADGGEVDAEEKRPDDIKYFSNVNRMKDRGVTTDSVMLGARTKAGEGSVMAGLNMANMSKEEKMQTARALMLAYTQQDPEGLGFTANVVKPSNAPAMANLIGSMPLGEGRVSAGMHGNQAYSLGYERPVEGGQFNANLNVPRGTMSSPQLNLQYNKRFADGGDVRQDEPFFDAASRTFVDVMTGRREPITGKDFTAKEQMAMMDAVKKSQARGGNGRVDYQDYPTGNEIGPGYVDIRNTLGGFQYKQNPDGSTSISDKYDFHGPRVAEYEKMGTGEKLVKSAKNALTEFVTKGFSPRDLAGELGRAYIGSKGPEVNIRIPVNRADGSPEEGERLTPQQIERLAMESNTPAFIAQKSGIGRKSGNISKALNSGTAYPAMAQGALDVPYDLAGLPVDLTTMVMRPFGYSNQKPFLGSDYLKEQATEAGIRRPTPEDPTLKGFHTFGELGAGLIAPGKVIEGAQALKGKAADMFAKFQESRTAKPGMTDLMTGQRFEAPVLTPQQQAQQQTVAAVFDNLAGANQEQIAADVAAGRLPAFVAPQLTAAEIQAQNIARLPQDAQEQLRLFEEAAARPRPVAIPGRVEMPAVQPPTTAIAQTGPATKLPPPPPFVAPPVSAEFPFVGRLDEFAAGMTTPAQKEQLINQVKGKFREQDVARLQEALAGLGPKDKVTPAMLQQALANTYSPNRYRSADVPTTGSMYDKSDNVFAQNKQIAGSMNLYLKETPEMLANMDEIAVLKRGLVDVFYGAASPEKIKNINQVLEKSPLAASIPEFGMLKQRMEDALPTLTRFNNMGTELSDTRSLILSPLSYKKDGFDYFKEIDRRVAAATAGMPDGFPKQIAAANVRITEEPKLVQEMMQKGSDQLVALGGQPIDVTGYMTRNGFLEPRPSNNGLLERHKQSVVNRAFDDDVIKQEWKDISTPLEKGVKAGLEQVRQKLLPEYQKLEKALEPYTGYAGRHRQATAGDNMPIGFSRFTEHTVDMNGQQLKGRHVHELQSDLSKDIKVRGPKGGSLEKDQKELDGLLDKQTKLMQESSDLSAQFVGMPDTDPLLQKTKSSLSALDAEIKKVDQRRKILKERVATTDNGKYFLEEPFAGFETNSPVRMQLLIKNAIQSSIRSGQDFVTFPGKESDKAKLYEKLLPNLKQAVKDLGGKKAGFEIKPITLPNPGGTEPTVWGVLWSPETAAKAIEKGVPFNKGGMVERKTDDNRRYM